MKRKVTNIGDLKINGYAGEYIFENIEKTHDFYEADTLKKWSGLIKDPRIIFDIGANLGNHTLYWSTRLSPEVIYSFEPLKANLECLQRNCDDNQLQERVVIVPEALGRQKSLVQIKNYDESNLGSTSFEVQESDDSEGIPLTTVDIFVQEKQLERLDFVKIDTEGFECDVLAGMQQSLQRFHPAIWVEVSGETAEEVNQFLEQRGYFLADVIKSNLLFLDKKIYSEITPYDFKQALYEMLRYLDHANFHYANYVKMKGWLENKIDRNTQLLNQNEHLRKQMTELDSQLTTKANDLQKLDREIKKQNEEWKSRYEQLEQRSNRLQEKNKTLLEIKERLTDDKSVLEQEVQRFGQLNREYAEALSEQAQNITGEIDLLLDLKKSVQRLEIQNDYLKRENLEYRRKFSKITDTWYGKLALKCYHLLKKIRSLFY